jgi:ribosomal protein S26
MFENRFFPGNIPIPKTFSFNQGSICDLIDFYKNQVYWLYTVTTMFENMYFCVNCWN